MDIGYRIKQLRTKNNLTLEELASRCELTKGFLSQLERNLTSPSIATLQDIVEALGTTLAKFFQEETEEKLVFTDGYTEGWKPAEKPFMTAILLLEDVGEGKTRYTAIARHPTKEIREQHEQMGFHEGWGIVLDQLVAYVKSLRPPLP